MIRSLSPRICCTVAMAPALTEATEARIRLTIPKSPPICGVRPVFKTVTSLELPTVVNLNPKGVSSIATFLPDGNESLNGLSFHVPGVVNSSADSKYFSTTKVSGIHRRVLQVDSCAVSGVASSGHSHLLSRGSMNKTLSSPCNDAAKTTLMSKEHCDTHGLLGDQKTRVVADAKQTPLSSSDSAHMSCSGDTTEHAKAITQSCAISVSQTAAGSAPEGTSCSTHDIANRFTTIERRTQHLVRRLRYMRARNLDAHVQQQIGGYLDKEQPRLQAVTDAQKENSQDDKSDILRGANVKNLSTSALVDFVRKYQTQNVSAASQLHFHNNVKGIKSESNDVHASPPDLSPQFTPSVEMCRSGKEFSGVLNVFAKNELSGFDCEATESSSGGESCDESPPAVDGLSRERKKPTVPLYMRSTWRWSCERAAIIARWTWLQAQVSDLEYRIRQQTEVYRQIRCDKGAVALGESTIPHDLAKCFKIPVANKTIPCVSAPPTSSSSQHQTSGRRSVEFSPACNISNVVNNVDKQSTRLSQSLGNCLSPLSPVVNSLKLHADSMSGVRCPNGFISSNHIVSPGGDQQSTKSDSVGSSATVTPDIGEHPGVQSPHVDVTCQSARCRPLKSHRKRKLLRAAGLHQVSRKAQRLASVRCQCYPPQSACVLCSGRYNNTQVVDAVMMPFIEKVSILDPSFHPVLSFDHDVPLAVYLDSLMKFGSWQKKHPVKAVRRKLSEKRRKKYSSPLKEVSDKTKRKYTKKSTNWIMTPSTNKLRKKFEKKSLRRLKVAEASRGSGDGVPQLATTSSREYRRRKKASGGSVVSTASSESSGRHTPGASPGAKDPKYMRDMRDAAASMRRRMAGNDYDIDNIVIPYSMAAATRVERLQYKEIDTPKWREIPEEVEAAKSAGSHHMHLDMTQEDISEESYSERHLSKQMQERKRFQNLIMYRRGFRAARPESAPIPIVDHVSPDSLVTSEDSAVTADIPIIPDMSDDGLANGHKPRSNSISQRSDRSSDDGAIHLLEYHTEPWQLRSFPLDDDTYRTMVSEQPSLTVSRSPRVPPANRCKIVGDLSVTRAASPTPSSVSNCGGEDEAMDPEWSLAARGEDEPGVD